jgi:TolB-like protein/predicted Zn-dependent protease
LKAVLHKAPKPVAVGRPLWTLAALGFAVVLVALLIGLVWSLPRREQPTAPSQPAATSDGVEALAVLPFVNEGGDPDAEFLADGLADGLSTSLAQVRRLQVRPLSSTLHFKGNKADDVYAVGRALRVQNLITGRVHKTGDQLLVTWQLVDVPNQRILIGDQHRRKLTDLLTLQSELTTEIAGKLRLQLTGEEQKSLSKRSTENVEAYQHYLKGRFYWYKFKEDAARKAVQHFQQAIEVEPNYAEAYAGLADAYWWLGEAVLPPREAAAKARAAAEKALQIDDQLAEAHGSLAMIQFSYDWDWPKAEKGLRRAVELNPRSALAHHQYGWCLALRGELDQAQAELQEALRLDPLSLSTTLDLYLPFYLKGQYDAAISQVGKVEELEPNYYARHFALGYCFLRKGELTRAVELFQEARRLEDRPWTASTVGYAYALMGKTAEAQQILTELESQRRQRYVNPLNFARIHTGLGNRAEALRWLEQGYEDRTSWMVWLKVDPTYDPIRTDPQFIDLVQRVGLSGNVTDKDKPLDSLAVLPFAHAGGDAEAAFLGEGLCISLTNSLSQVRVLKVRPFTSVARYKGPDADALKAARELQVRAVCTGTIQKRGEEMLIHVELVDVEANTQLWGEQFRRKYTDLFAVQEELAKEITAKLRLRLSGEDAKRLTKRPTESLEAFRLYTLGRVEWYKFTEEGLKRAIDYFNKALEHDPKYALAYSGLADAYFSMSDEYRPPREVLPLAKQAAQKALELDSSLAEAHTSLALIYLFLELDWEKAEKGFKQALDLNPNYALAQHMYGWYLILSGRPEEGRPYIERAVRLEPDNVFFAVELSAPDYALRRYDRALEQLDRAKAADPKSHATNFLRGWIYVHMGDLDRALALFQETRKVNEDPETLTGLGSAYALAGQRADAMKMLNEMQAMSQRRYVSPFNFAMICTALGDNDQAMAHLEKAYADRSPLLVWLNVEPLFDRLRSDPRFIDLMRRVAPPKQTP